VETLTLIWNLKGFHPRTKYNYLLMVLEISKFHQQQKVT
jgi:hypothetical protein